MGKIELFNLLQWIIIIISYLNHTTVYKLFVLDRIIWWIELLMLNNITWNYLTLCKQIISFQ